VAAGVFLLTLTLLDFLVLGDEAFAKSNTFCPGGGSQKPDEAQVHFAQRETHRWPQHGKGVAT